MNLATVGVGADDSSTHKAHAEKFTVVDLSPR